MGLASFPGGGGTSAAPAVAVGDLTDIGDVGDDVARADNVAAVVTALGGAAAVRGAINAAQVGARPSALTDALDGSGWDSNSATGSAVASWETAPARLRLTCPALGSAASCGVHAEGYVDSPVWGDLAIRVRVVVGDGSSAGRIGFAIGRSAAANVSINLWPSSNVECGHYGSGSFSSLATVAGPDSGQRTGGQLWLKISRTPTGVAFAWGVGSGGELPEQWTTTAISTSTTVLDRASGTYVEIFGLTTVSAAVTADVLDVKQGLPGAF